MEELEGMDTAGKDGKGGEEWILIKGNGKGEKEGKRRDRKVRLTKQS